MNYQKQIESGLQLLSRLINRPSLQELDNALFPKGLKSDDIVEINGPLSSGKTALLTHLIKNGVLIDKFQDKIIGGLNIGIIFIDLDLKFYMLRLVNSIKDVIRNLKYELTDFDEEFILKKSLGNLHYIKCYDSQELHCALRSLQEIITENSNIALLIVDNISANYYSDLEPNGIRKMDLYKQKIIQSIQKFILDFKIALIYTKPNYFRSKNPLPDNQISYKINTTKSHEANDVFTASVSQIRTNNSYHLNFKLNSNDIAWI